MALQLHPNDNARKAVRRCGSSQASRSYSYNRRRPEPWSFSGRQRIVGPGNRAGAGHRDHPAWLDHRVCRVLRERKTRILCSRLSAVGRIPAAILAVSRSVIDLPPQFWVRGKTPRIRTNSAFRENECANSRWLLRRRSSGVGRSRRRRDFEPRLSDRFPDNSASDDDAFIELEDSIRKFLSAIREMNGCNCRSQRLGLYRPTGTIRRGDQKKRSPRTAGSS